MHRPVASAGAGWRPSDVLCRRSGPAPPGGTRGAGMGVPGRIGGDPGVDAARHLQRSGRVRAVEESGRVDRLSRLGQGVAAVPPGIKHTFWGGTVTRSEEHTSELQSLMRISYAVFCLKKKKKINRHKRRR